MYVAVICVMAVGLVVSANWATPVAGPDFWNAFASLLALALLAEIFSTQMLRSTATTSVSFVPYLATMILLGGPWAMAVSGISQFTAETLIRRKELIKVLHNTAQYCPVRS